MEMKWSKELATGLDLIDNQHKELFQRIDKLLSACLKNKAEEEIRGTLEFLNSYTILHFGEEEKLMSEYNYPDHTYHRDQHSYFAKELARLNSELKKEGLETRFLLHVNFVLVDWEIDHVKNVDKKLVTFLSEKLP